jgi:hypothetical protein
MRHGVALKTLREGTFCGVLSFGVKGGEDAAVGNKVRRFTQVGE